MLRWIIKAALCCLVLLPQINWADTDGQLYLAAKKAALQDNWPLFTSLKDQLTHYPLLPYLEFYQIEGNLKTTDAAAIQKYLNTYPNTPLSNQLRQSWLNLLADQKDWKAFLARYQPTNSLSLQCDYLYALQQEGKSAEAAPQIASIWLTGNSLPESCSPVFEPWLTAMPIKNELIWERFHLALKNYNFGLANYLSDRLPWQEKNEAQAIIRLFAQPSLIMSKSFLNQHSSPEVISYGIARLARISPTSAANIWEKLQHKYPFTSDQKQRVYQAIALKLALRKNSDSLIWFRKVVTDNLDPVYEDWLIRAALYHGDWQLVKSRIMAMPKDERESLQWKYWYARALEKLGDKQSAKNDFVALSKKRSYYGFLAATHLKQAVQMFDYAPRITQKETEEVEQLPAFQRAKLLHQLKQEYEATLELIYLLKITPPSQQYIIIKLISAWNWYPQMLILSDKITLQDDINLRFPLLHQGSVIQNAKLRNLNAALIYAIMRQESYFSASAISPAGAYGLMQLIPTTALNTSKQFRLKYTSSTQLLNPEINIGFGAANLKNTLSDFDGNPILAIAAYNAGPEAVARWLPKTTEIPADIWIETIPYHETRNYIKNVLSNYVVYQYQLAQSPSLLSIMPTITSAVTKEKSNL